MRKLSIMKFKKKVMKSYEKMSLLLNCLPRFYDLCPRNFDWHWGDLTKIQVRCGKHVWPDLSNLLLKQLSLSCGCSPSIHSMLLWSELSKVAYRSNHFIALFDLFFLRNLNQLQFDHRLMNLVWGIIIIIIIMLLWYISCS